MDALVEEVRSVSGDIIDPEPIELTTESHTCHPYCGRLCECNMWLDSMGLVPWGDLSRSEEVDNAWAATAYLACLAENAKESWLRVWAGGVHQRLIKVLKEKWPNGYEKQT